MQSEPWPAADLLSGSNQTLGARQTMSEKGRKADFPRKLLPGLDRLGGYGGPCKRLSSCLFLNRERKGFEELRSKESIHL